MIPPSHLIKSIIDAPFSPARDYLLANKHRGKQINLPAMDSRCYIVSNVICGGINFSMTAPLSATGQVACLLEESDTYIGDSHEQKRADLLRAITYLPSESLGEAAPLFPLWSANLSHWLFQCLGKVLLFERIGFTGYYITHSHIDFVTQSLHMLGISDARILPCDKLYFIERAFLADPLLADPTLESKPNLLRLLRDSILDSVGREPGEKNCYIKRIGTRKILNEEELLETLKDYDLEVMIPEEQPSLHEEIRFMTNVGLTITSHGANTSLALFQKNNSVFFELFSRTSTYHLLHPVLPLVNILYIPISERSRYSMHDNVHINIHTKSLDFIADVRLIHMILNNIRNNTYSINIA